MMTFGFQNGLILGLIFGNFRNFFETTRFNEKLHPSEAKSKVLWVPDLNFSYFLDAFLTSESDVHLGLILDIF
jgi:hypothetical protein